MMLLFNAVIVMAVLLTFIFGGKEEITLVGNNVATSMPWLGQKWLYIPLILGSIYMFAYSLRDAAIAIRIIRTGDTTGFQPGCSSPFPSEVSKC